MAGLSSDESSEDIEPLEFHKLHNDQERFEVDYQYLMQRHRLDYDKLFYGKDGGYPLRKFKKVYKRH